MQVEPSLLRNLDDDFVLAEQATAELAAVARVWKLEATSDDARGPGTSVVPPKQ